MEQRAPKAPVVAQVLQGVREPNVTEICGMAASEEVMEPEASSGQPCI